MEPYLFHGFRNFNLETLYRVLHKGYILPGRWIEDYDPKGKNLYNGNSFISLCQKSQIDSTMKPYYASSYDDRIYNQLCVVISDEIEFTYPNFISFDEFYPELREKLVRDDSPVRFSSYLDEVQTDVPIPIEKFLAIGYPIEHFSKDGSHSVKNDVQTIYRTLEEVGLDIPVLNSSIYDFADEKDCFIRSKIKK